MAGQYCTFAGQVLLRVCLLAVLLQHILRRQFVNSLDVMVQPHQLCPVVFVQVLEDIALTVQNQLVAKVPFCGFNVRTHASGPLC